MLRYNYIKHWLAQLLSDVAESGGLYESNHVSRMVMVHEVPVCQLNCPNIC